MGGGGLSWLRGLGANQTQYRTIDGELAVTIRQLTFVRTTNQRSVWRYWPRRQGAMATTTTRSQWRSCDAKKKKRFRLTLTTIQHNEEAGMRDNDLHRQRLQQRTVGLALAGLEKGELFVLKKTIGFALTKADWFALRKAGWFAFKKAFFRL